MDYGTSDYPDKNAITALLKGIDPDTDVFYEEIKGTEEKHGLDEPETYYFVDIIPNGNETVDRFLRIWECWLILLTTRKARAIPPI